MSKLEHIIKSIALPGSLIIALNLAACQTVEPKNPQPVEQIETRRTYPSDYIPKFETTTHKLLLIEEEYGVETQVFKELDEIIEKSIKNIPQSTNLTAENVSNILFEIGSVLKDYDSGHIKHPLLSQSLLNNNLDCDARSMLYLAVCETINLPIHLIYVPEHVSISVPLNGSHIAWETTSNKQLDESKFGKKFSNTIFPVEMDAKKLMAAIYDNLGLAWLKNTEPLTGADYFYAEKNITKAIELFPDFWDAHYNLATLYMDRNDNLNSLKEFSKAIFLWDSDAISYNQRGVILDRLSRTDEAIADYSKAIALKPDLKVAYLNRSLAYSAKGMADEVLTDLQKLDELSQPVK